MKFHTIIVTALLATICCAQSVPNDPKSKARASGADLKVYALGETVSFKNSDWVILSSASKGKSLKSTTSGYQDAKTDGDYIQVAMKVTNKTDKEERLALWLPVIVDSKFRQFKNISDEIFYLPDTIKIMRDTIIPAGMSRETTAIFEVAPGAQNLQLIVRDFAFFGKKAYVNLSAKK